MTWQEQADKHVNTPVVLVSVAFNSGTRYYSDDNVRTPTQPYEGKILSLPDIKSSVGSTKRTYIRNRLTIILDDSDKEFFTLIESESFKNVIVKIQTAFVEDSYANPLTLFTGYIYDWEWLDNLQFAIYVEEKSRNLENEYPDKRVLLSDYPKAHESARNIVIPVPYGKISANGLSDDGAFGHPSLKGGTGLLFVDPTQDAEIHLVGLQAFLEEVTNGGFASSTTGWSAGNSATLACVAGGKIGNCLKITENGANFPYAQQTLTLLPGSTYIVTGWVKEGTENEYALQVWDLTNGCTLYNTGFEDISGLGWTSITVNESMSTPPYTALFTVPDDCTSVGIRLYSNSLNGEAKNIYFDEISLYEVINIDKAFIDGVEKDKTPPVYDYAAAYNIIDGFVHTTIEWESGVRPTESNRISADISFGARRPVVGIRHFLENFCSYIASDFNSTSYATAKEKETSRLYDFAGSLYEIKKLQTILDNWRFDWEMDMPWNKDGEMCFNYLSSVFTSPPRHYEDLRDILDEFGSDPQVHEIVNYVRYWYNFHYSKAYYYNSEIYQNTDSQSDHGATFKKEIPLKWTRTPSVALDIAMRKVIRLSDPIVFDQLPFPLKTFSDDLVDVLKITHFAGKGSDGYVGKYFQVRNFQQNLDRYINDMMLEDVSNFIGGGCILGDGNVLPAKWTDASGAERDYCYMCDLTTGQFSDGEPGKELHD